MRPRAFLLAASLIVLGARPGAAQPADAQPSWTQSLGKPIAAIRLVIDGREVQDAEVSRALETAVGRPLTADSVRQSIVRLMAIARFDEVAAEADISASGVVLTYLLTPAHPIRKIRFRGDLGLPEKQLRAVVTERYTESPPLHRVREIADLLEAICRDHGFLKATARPTTEVTDNPDQTTLTFEMAAGPQARISSAEIEGAPEGNAALVRSKLRIQPGAPFDRVAIDAAVGRYLAELRAASFLEARIETDPKYSENQEQVDVTVRMTRGPRVTVVFRGDPLPERRRKRDRRASPGGGARSGHARERGTEHRGRAARTRLPRRRGAGDPRDPAGGLAAGCVHRGAGPPVSCRRRGHRWM